MMRTQRSPATAGLRSAAALLVCGALVSACAPGAPSPGGAAPGAAPRPSAAEATPVPPGIHWVRTAAEHRVIYETTFAAAASAVGTRVAGMAQAWAVVVDADETLLDNSLYQLRRARQGLGYTPESWNDWVREEAASALPGAVAFTRRVRELGGIVAVVTNRDEAVCPETRRNLSAEGIIWDVVLCRTGPSEKETRFSMVSGGSTPVGLPPLEIVAFVGDNIEDFPGGEQTLRAAPEAELAAFGTRFFVLPNPMYGSWTSNPGG